MSEKQDWVAEAPLLIFVCVDLRRDKQFTEYFGGEWAESEGFGGLLFPLIDASLATQNMVTAAEMMGLGSVIIGTPTQHPKEVAALLELPERVYPLMLVCIGYPDHEPRKKYRWETEDVTHHNTYEDLKEERIERYGRKIEEFTGMQIEAYIKKMEEHYDPEQLKASFHPSFHFYLEW